MDRRRSWPRHPRLPRPRPLAILRARHYSPRTEKAYVAWIRRFILFHGKRHPDGLGAPEVAGYLSHLATKRQVSASTQNQAFSALLFLYREVLGRELAGLERRPARRSARACAARARPARRWAPSCGTCAARRGSWRA